MPHLLLVWCLFSLLLWEYSTAFSHCFIAFPFVFTITETPEKAIDDWGMEMWVWKRISGSGFVGIFLMVRSAQLLAFFLEMNLFAVGWILMLHVLMFNCKLTFSSFHVATIAVNCHPILCCFAAWWIFLQDWDTCKQVDDDANCWGTQQWLAYLAC